MLFYLHNEYIKLAPDSLIDKSLLYKLSTIDS